ncbi:MAG: hypothetical protein M1812_004579 [Candelaria pacifica]|nr:MAG: hypothetical protein M1812_004579 [Candelaria pacifica]
MASRQARGVPRAILPQFRFLSLPPEIRNMIYKYLVIASRPGGAIVWGFEWGCPRKRLHKIDIAILLVNQQLHQEAAAILYGENQIRLAVSNRICPKFRVDNQLIPNFRVTRSGRTTSKVPDTGTMYEHVFARFRKIRFGLSIEQRHLTSTGAADLSNNLERLCLLLVGKDDLKNLVVGTIPRRTGGWGDSFNGTYLPIILRPFEALRNVRKVKILIEGTPNELRKQIVEKMMAKGPPVEETNVEAETTVAKGSSSNTEVASQVTHSLIGSPTSLESLQ